MKKNKKRLATKVLSTALLSSLIVTSLGDITYVKASDTVQEVTINSDVKAGYSSIENISKVDTEFKGLLVTGQTYIVHNYDKEKPRYVSARRTNNIFAFADFVTFKEDGSIKSVNSHRQAYDIEIPAGGYAKVVIDSKETNISITLNKDVFNSNLSISETDNAVLTRKNLEVGKYYDITNVTHKELNLSIDKGSYDAPRSIVTYNKDKVMVSEATQSFNTNYFTIPENGMTRFIQGEKDMILYYPSELDSSLNIESHNKDGKDLREWSLELDEVEESYLTYKEIKLTNKGGDNNFKINLSNGLSLKGDQNRTRYLSSGESTTIVVKADSKNYTQIDGLVTITESQYTADGRTTELPVTFKAPEVGTKKAEIKDIETGNPDKQAYKVKIGDNESSYLFSIDEVNNELAKSKGYNKTFVSTDRLGGTNNHHSAKYYEGARLAYEGQMLSASAISGKSYSVSSDFSFSSESGNAIGSNYAVTQVIEAGFKRGNILAPYYIYAKDCLNDFSKADDMRYMYENGEISADDYNLYIDNLYANVMNDNLDSLVSTVKRDLTTGLTLDAVALLGGPSAWGLGALFSLAYATQDWAIANVNEVWDSNVAYWIGYNATGVAEGRYASYRYTDKNGKLHEITKDENKVLN